MGSPNVCDPHAPLTRGFNLLCNVMDIIMYLLEYRTDIHRRISFKRMFRRRDDAESMADFYRSCGARASVRFVATAR